MVFFSRLQLQFTPLAMPYCILLLLTAVAAQASLYFPPTIQVIKSIERDHTRFRSVNFSIDFQEEHLLAQRHRQNNIDTLNDFIDAVNSYAEYFGNSRLSGDFDNAKEIPIDLPGDYETVETFNPNPSIRDQEYLQHSTLWSNHHANDYYRGNDRHRIQAIGSKGGKDDKTENALPAYCTPPNPCPIGYTSELCFLLSSTQFRLSAKCLAFLFFSFLFISSEENKKSWLAKPYMRRHREKRKTIHLTSIR